jgi:PTH2 family peptidyl-tRNA hydrolase
MLEYDIKQVIVVRQDIKMSRGKLAAQVAHASVSAFYKTLTEKPKYSEQWLANHQPKIILVVNNLDELLKIKEELDKKGIINEIIRDAGLTELPPGTITCIGIGPAPKEKIDEVTGKLKLL